MIAFLIAQAIICGQYGASPTTPGGCYQPYGPAQGGVYLQQVLGQPVATPIPPGPGPVPYQIWNQPQTNPQ